MPSANNHLRRVLFSSSIGGVLEMYDFVLFIFLAPILAQQFLPKQNPTLALMYTLVIFAVGYLVRPLGGMVFGHYGDRIGRKRGLLVAITLMGVATVAIGCLPTYKQIGAASTVLLLLCRLLQGIAIGGDFPGALIFTGEHSSKNTISFNCSLVFLGINLGSLLGAGVVTGMHYALSVSAMQSWGWRLPFLASVLLFLLGRYMRKRAPESAGFLEHQQKKMLHRVPLVALWNKHSILISRGCGLFSLFAMCISLLFLYMPNFLQFAVGVTQRDAALHNLFSLLLFCTLLPVMGMMLDRSKFFNYERCLFIAGSFFLIFSYPLYVMLLRLHSFSGLQAVLSLFDLFAALLVATSIRALVVLFPLALRYTGVGLCYNLCFALFGGLSPLLATFLIHHNHAHAIGLLFAGAALALLLSRVGMRPEAA